VIAPRVYGDYTSVARLMYRCGERRLLTKDARSDSQGPWSAPHFLEKSSTTPKHVCLISVPSALGPGTKPHR